MQDLSALLGDIADEFPDAIEGKNPNSGFDGPPVPSTRQYRATVIRSEWRQAKTSGKYSYSLTFEITAPEEYAGKKFSEYFNVAEDAPTIAREKFARLIGESGIDIKTADTSSEEAFAKEFEGKQFVIATRLWGDSLENNGIRYLNKDRGQALLDKISPPNNEAAQKAKLKSDIRVNKGADDQGPFPETPEEDVTETPEEQAQAPTEQVRLPGGARPGGVNLPQGLRT